MVIKELSLGEPTFKKKKNKIKGKKKKKKNEYVGS